MSIDCLIIVVVAISIHAHPGREGRGEGGQSTVMSSLYAYTHNQREEEGEMVGDRAHMCPDTTRVIDSHYVVAISVHTHTSTHLRVPKGPSPVYDDDAEPCLVAPLDQGGGGRQPFRF